jgi:L-lactate utilization protein LutC
MPANFFYKIRTALTQGPIRKHPLVRPETHHARLFDQNMTSTQCIELMRSRSAMSGAIIHQAQNIQQLFDCIQKIVPLGGIILIDDETELSLPPALNVQYKTVPLTNAADDTLFSASAAITGVDFAIAETASIVLSDSRPKVRLATNTVEIHIALIRPDQIIPDLMDLPEKMKQCYGDRVPTGMTIISGPSKTSDIEMNLVVGVHGPGQLHYIILPD